MSRKAIVLAEVIAWGGWLLHCGASAPPARTPQVPAVGDSSQPVSALSSPLPPTPPTYNRATDPMWLSYDREENPFRRRAIARLWVASAQAEEAAGSQRLRTATSALEETRSALTDVGDPCSAPAASALEWERVTKQSYERRLLLALQEWGENNIDTRVLDLQVQALRDEIFELERLLKPCPKSYFAPEVPQ